MHLFVAWAQVGGRGVESHTPGVLLPERDPVTTAEEAIRTARPVWMDIEKRK